MKGNTRNTIKYTFVKQHYMQFLEHNTPSVHKFGRKKKHLGNNDVIARCLFAKVKNRPPRIGEWRHMLINGMVAIEKINE